MIIPSNLLFSTDAPKENATGIAGLDGPKVQHHIRVPTPSASVLPTYDFLSMMHTFTSSILSYHTNKLALHQRKAKSALLRSPRKKIKQPSVAEGKKPELAEQDVVMEESPEKTAEEEAMEEVKQTLNAVHKSAFKIPNLFVPLSSLLPSAAKGRPWAKEMLEISFKGLAREAEASLFSKPTTPGNGLLSPPQTQPSQSTPPSQFHSQSHESSKHGNSQMSVEAVLVARGHVLSSLPSGLLDKQAIDGGIAFNTSTNSFAFRLQSKIGEPVIDALVMQLQRVSRLVDFVQTMEKHKDNLGCESVSLNRLEFTYLYRPCGKDGKPAEPFKETAVIEFPSESAGDAAETQLILPAGNPHIRVIDRLTNILNDPKYGLQGLAINLPMTLPIVRALDTAEAAWVELAPKTNSEFFVITHASDKFVLKYAFRLPSRADKDEKLDAEAQAADEQRRLRRINIDVSQGTRQGAVWWWIRRSGYDSKKIVPRNDGFDKLLKEEVWSKTIRDVWNGQSLSAIAKVPGAERMVGAVDAVMQKIAKDPVKYLGEAEPAQTAPTAPVAQMATGQAREEKKPQSKPAADQAEQAPQQQPQPQPQQRPNLQDRAATMQLKLPPKRPQPQTAHTAHPPSTGPPKATPVQKNPTAPMANMRGAAAPSAPLGGVPMSVSASMPGKPSSMGPAGPNAIQQAMLAAGRGKSMSPTLNKKVQQGAMPPNMPGVAGGAMVPAGQMPRGPVGVPPNLQGMSPAQVQQMQMIHAQRMRTQQAQQAAMRGGMVQGGVQPGQQPNMQQQRQGQQGQAGGGGGQGKIGGVDAPMVID